jgi:hypothetical protein
MHTSNLSLGLALVLALAAGFCGITFVFSDLGPGESWASRFVVTAGFNLLCGFAIGFFFPKYWLVAPVSSWGSVLFGLLYMQGALLQAEGYQPDPDPTDPPYIVFALLVLLGPPLLSLAGGFAGRLIGRRVFRALPPTTQ